MGEQVEIYQQVHNYQWICPPPCAFLNGPNEYVVWQSGEEKGKIVEEENCLCQKGCCPMARKYESKVIPKHGGNEYKVVREIAIG